MHFDIETSPPANVWNLNSKGSSPLGKLIAMASPSQVYNFAPRGISVVSILAIILSGILNFFKSDFWSSPDRQKVMHMSPPRMSTGGLKNQ